MQLGGGERRATASGVPGRIRYRGPILSSLMNALRPYRAPDRDACLRIFDSNTPPFFDVSERADFEAFLDAPSEAYFVLAVKGDLVAFGGLALSPPRVSHNPNCARWLRSRTQPS